MKRWMKATLWSLFGIGVIFLLVGVKSAIDKSEIGEPNVHIEVDGENSFLNENELITRLKAKNYVFVGQQKKDVKVDVIEQFIASMPEVKTVEVYQQINGQIDIDIALRKPIARVFNKWGESYYIDADGFMMKIPENQSARVVVVTGDIEDKYQSISMNDLINNDSLISNSNYDDVYRISNYVCNDPLMQSLVGQIHRENNGDFVLIPMVGGQKIIFGSAQSTEEVEEKFKKLKIFYKEAIPYEGWEKYQEISLKYDDQIVCKKK